MFWNLWMQKKPKDASKFGRIFSNHLLTWVWTTIISILFPGVSHQSNSRGFIPIIIRISVIFIGGMSLLSPTFGDLDDLGTHDSSMDDVRSQVLMGTVRRLLADATGHDSRLPGLGMGRSSCNGNIIIWQGSFNQDPFLRESNLMLKSCRWFWRIIPCKNALFGLVTYKWPLLSAVCFCFPHLPWPRAENGDYLRQAMMELLGKACCCDFWPG